MDAALTRLSPRLRAVAGQVPPGLPVADVGTDHAQLLAWLVTQGRTPRAIGIDVRPGPLRQARHTLDATGATGVELRHGDGLEPLRAGEVDVAVLAGMGGARIVRLLRAAPQVVAGLRRIVLQPNTDWALVRRWVMEHGQLEDERMVQDRGKFYVVLSVCPERGRPSEWTEDDLVLGPRLRRARPAVFMAWLGHELRRVERALTRAERGRRDADRRVERLQRRRSRLRAELER